MSEKITARMKWIVKQLKDHEGARITHRRDWFLEKSFYTLEWNDGEGYHCVEVTDKMRKQLSATGLIEIVEERPVYSKGEFRTTERDWGLPKRQPTQLAPDVLVRCAKCNALIETTVHCDNCGTFEPTRR